MEIVGLDPDSQKGDIVIEDIGPQFKIPRRCRHTIDLIQHR